MFISHNAAQLYSVEFGKGARTILAHGGWTGSWELWAGPFNLLSKTWRTVAYDHRGTGRPLHLWTQFPTKTWWEISLP